ncbi:MAG: hypothetical protein AB7H90_19790 [Alphaproteobacteria bacterium]
MRFTAVRLAWLGVAMTAAAVSACAPVERNTVEVGRVYVDTVGIEPVAIPELVRADPEEVAERAFVGGALGAMLGAGFAATASANPAFGAIIGGPAGAAIGTVVGIATARPLPSYASIVVPAAPVIPGFYDIWPPGYRSPPPRAQVPPPPERNPALAATDTPGEGSLPAGGLAPVATSLPAPL